MVYADKTIKIFIGTGETSGDFLANHFVNNLQKYIKDNYPKGAKNIEFYAVSGSELKANPQIKTFINNDKLSVMGLIEILLSLPRLLLLRKKIINFCLSWQADIFIGVDSPDFYLKIAQKLKKKGIKTIHLVCPSIYAWRAYRLKKIAKSVDLLIGIMPFEKKFIDQYCLKNQLKLNYQAITHPLYQHNAQKTNKLKKIVSLGNKKIIALFLGSRKSEINRHLTTIIQFIKVFRQNYPDYLFISSVSSKSLQQIIAAKIKEQKLEHIFYNLVNCHQEVIEKAEFIICKSGTITLHCAKAHKPMIIYYQLNPLTFYIAQFLAYQKYVSLVNYALAQPTFPELLQQNFNAKNLMIEAEKIMHNPHQFDQAFEQIDCHFYLKSNTKVYQEICNLIDLKLNENRS